LTSYQYTDVTPQCPAHMTGVALSLRSRILEIGQRSGTIPDPVDAFDSHLLQDREAHIDDRRRLLGVQEVTTAFQPSVGTADEDRGRVEWAVLIAVAQSAPIEQERVIQHGAVALRRVTQFFREPSEDGHVIRTALRVLANLVRIVLMVRT